VNHLSLYCRYIGVSFRGQMQYRMSFLMSATGQLISTFIEVAAIWALFSRFGNLEFWRLEEVCLFYGVVNISFALADAVSTGFDVFGPQYIKTGNFDRLLLRPRPIVLQLLGHELALRRAGRLIQGLAVFLWGASQLNLDWSLMNYLLLVFTILGGMALFSGLLVFQATLSIWTVESLEIMNTLTYGGVQTAQYPLSIYESWFRKFFTFIVPLACISYFPVIALMDKQDPLGSTYLLQVMSPIMGFVFLGCALTFFQFGVRKYTSTGS
jgi:ABC-2 type transport system permease protein